LTATNGFAARALAPWTALARTSLPVPVSPPMMIGIQGFHAGVRRSGIGGADGKHGLYEYTMTQMAYVQT
jgi:hypothetical protein